MAMRRKIGILCLVLGFALMACAGLLLWHNQAEDTAAETAVTELIPQLLEKIPQVPPEEKIIQQLTPVDFLPPSAFEMTRVKIGGHEYIGYLSLPTLELELPIMADWDLSLVHI